MRSNNKLKAIGLMISVLLTLTAICGVSLLAGATVSEDNATAAVEVSESETKYFDSVSAAIEYATANNLSYVSILKSTDEDLTIPYGMSVDAGNNAVNGDVVNQGDLYGGIYSGKVTNHANIYSGIYTGEVVVMGDTQLDEDNVITGALHAGRFEGKVTLCGGEILGGGYYCELVLEVGSTFNNESGDNIEFGGNFKLTNNGGTINCTNHIGEATCTDPASCLICGESFGDPDSDRHVEGTAATCLSYAICDLCGEEYGELADHSFDENGKCTISGCDVVAEVRIGGVFYTTYSEALANAVSSDMIVAVRDFETDGLDIPAGIVFDGDNFTVTIGEDYDVTVYGMIVGGTFVVSDGRMIGVEEGGVIEGGSFYGDVLNSGTISAGSFLYGGLYNNPSGVIENNGDFVFGEDVSFENLSGYVSCIEHVGGESTCMEPATCILCEAAYGDIVDHMDYDRNHVCDYGCDDYVGEHSDSSTDTDHLCDHGCGETLEACSGGQPTCTSLAICEICGETYGEVDANAHKWLDATVDDPKTCELCGKTEGDPLPEDTSSADGGEQTTTDGGEQTTDGNEQTTDSGEQTTTDGGEQTTVGGEQTTVGGEQTTVGGEQTTTGGNGNKKKGCKGMVGIGAVAILVTTAVGFISFKKKED